MESSEKYSYICNKSAKNSLHCTMKFEYTEKRVPDCRKILFSKIDDTKEHLKITDSFLKDLFPIFAQKCLPSIYNDYKLSLVPYLFTERQLDTALLPALYELCDGHVFAELPVYRNDEHFGESSGRADYWCMYKGYSFLIEVKHTYVAIKNAGYWTKEGHPQHCWEVLNDYQMKSVLNELKRAEEERKGIIRLALEFVVLKEGSTFKPENCGENGVSRDLLNNLASAPKPAPNYVAAWYIKPEIVEIGCDSHDIFCPVLTLLAKTYRMLK